LTDWVFGVKISRFGLIARCVLIWVEYCLVLVMGLAVWVLIVVLMVALFVQRQCRTTSCGRVPPSLFLVSISVQISSITWCASFNVSLQF
jgi:hypothetical protein